MIKYSGGFKRAAALMLSVLMLLSQMALPMAALALGDLSDLPSVTLYYTVNDEPMHVEGYASLYGEETVYWLTVPQEAFEQPMELVIDESDFVCVSSNGEILYPADAQSMQDIPATEIQLYDDDQLIGFCPLYVSSMPMPEPEDENDGWGDDDDWGDGDDWGDDWGDGDGSDDNGDWGDGWEDEEEEPEQPEWDEPESDESELPEWDEPEWNEPEQPEWDEPEQPEPQPAQVVINYADENGAILFQESQTLYEGEHTIRANVDAVHSYGYELEGGDSVSASVQVYADGTASRNPVTFTIRQKEQEKEDEGTLVETYECEGRTIKGSLRFRSTMSTATDRNIVFEKIPIGTIVWVYSQLINKDGEAWYSIRYNEVDCFVRADCLEVIDSTEPVTAEVTFYYTDENGKELYPVYRETFEEGTHDVSRYRYEAPEGYTYSYATADTVTVDEAGANPESVTFIYAEVKPITAEVTFYYTDENGKELYPVYKDTFGEGTHDVSRYRYEAPEGYTYSYATADTITVDEDGANPESVTFIYAEVKPITAEVTFYYTDESGRELYPVYKDTFGEGTHDVSRYRYEAPEGYTYSYATADTITVDEAGANPESVTFIYAEVKPITAEATFFYTDESGKEVYPSFTESFEAGTHDVMRYRKEAPEGYTYSYATADTITVDEAGANPETVTFIYAEVKPATAEVAFYFTDEEGRELYPSFTETFEAGTYEVTQYRKEAPDGYVYSYATADSVTVNENSADPNTVTFVYTSLPGSVELPVRFLDTERNPIAPDSSVSFQRGEFGQTYASVDYLYEPDGYRYASVNADEIVIDAYGNITPEVLEFTFVEKPKAEASVTFEYICNRRAIADPLTVKLPEGTHDVSEYAANPEGYLLKEVSSQTVTVDANGKANPAVITFTYEEVSHTAILRVHYRNSIGAELPGSPEIRELEAGEHTITPNQAYAPAGHTLSGSTQSYRVTVGSDLVAYPNSVVFTYYDSDITGSVTVNYYNSATNELIASEVRQLAPGVYDLTPNQELVDSKGKYEISDVITNTNTRVEVKENGQALPTVINFYYKPADIDVYQGYLLVTRQTALRKQPAQDAQSVMTLPVDTVLWTAGQYQSGSILWNSSQVASNSSLSGWVNDADVRRISADEANARLEEEEEAKQPDQDPGYYITVMNNVPLRRYMDTAAQAKYLKLNTVVYVSEQSFDENGYLWHKTTYDGVTGYVRDGQLRKLTRDEVEEYLSSGNPIDPGESEGGSQYDPNGASSYGYVTKNSVNFRATPNGTRLKMLNEYAMALILDTEEVNGVTWYNVNYSGQTGWIHGDYFHQMTLNEFNAFVGSPEYYKGITNNTAAPTAAPSTGNTGSTGGSTGSATQGSVSSVEDWNVGMWQNTGVTTQTSYQPFNPYATPVATMSPVGQYTTSAAGVKLYDSASAQSASTTLPQGAQVEITGTTVINGTTWYTVLYNGQKKYMEAGVSLKEAAATSTPTPTPTFVIGTMIPISYEDESKETQTGAVPWGLIGGAIALVGGAGGVYAYALNQNKRRKAAAARAAANRRKAAAAAGTSAAAGASSPYARRAVAAPPVSGTQQNRAGAPAQQPYGSAMQNPYSNGSITGGNAQSPYARPDAAYGTQQPKAPQASSYQPQANPYAAPVSSTENRPSAASNPYARPISTPPVQPQAAQADPTAPRRRATRMQRYHEAGSEDGNE